MPPYGQSGRQVHHVLGLSVCPSLSASGSDHYQTCEHDVMDELISMQIGTNGLLSKNMKRSTFGVRRSNVKVT